VAFLQSLDADILELAIGIAVLLFALGPQDLGRVSDAFLTARDRGHDSEASRLAATLSGGGEQPEDEPARSLAVATGLLEQSCQRLFGPLLWFVLLGPLGAALYRLAALTVEQASRHEQASPNLAGSAQQLLALLDWLPARLTTAAFAAAGNFDAVSHAWREHTGPVDQKSDAETLLSAAGRAALGSWPDEEEIGAGEQPPVVEDAMALIWRSLVVGLLVLAAGSLFAVLL
jgi:membrane protein required for beta-lactamase induction